MAIRYSTCKLFVISVLIEIASCSEHSNSSRLLSKRQIDKGKSIIVSSSRVDGQLSWSPLRLAKKDLMGPEFDHDCTSIMSTTFWGRHIHTLNREFYLQQLSFFKKLNKLNRSTITIMIVEGFFQQRSCHHSLQKRSQVHSLIGSITIGRIYQAVRGSERSK